MKYITFSRRNKLIKILNKKYDCDFNFKNHTYELILSYDDIKYKSDYNFVDEILNICYKYLCKNDCWKLTICYKSNSL